MASLFVRSENIVDNMLHLLIHMADFGLKIAMPLIEELEEMLPGQALVNICAVGRSTGLGHLSNHIEDEAEKNKAPVRPKQLLVEAAKTAAYEAYLLSSKLSKANIKQRVENILSKDARLKKAKETASVPSHVIAECK